MEITRIFTKSINDNEWGVPSYDDRYLFEMLILEGAHAGLSFELILKKREGYRKAFCNFDPIKVAKMTDEELDALCNNPNIVRNRLKIYSARKNAQVFIEIQKEYGSFSDYLWGFINHAPINNTWEKVEDIPCKSTLSDTISKDLKKRGMSFVGTKIIYSYIQAVGMVNDHYKECICSN